MLLPSLNTLYYYVTLGLPFKGNFQGVSKVMPLVVCPCHLCSCSRGAYEGRAEYVCVQSSCLFQYAVIAHWVLSCPVGFVEREGGAITCRDRLDRSDGLSHSGHL